MYCLYHHLPKNRIDHPRIAIFNSPTTATTVPHSQTKEELEPYAQIGKALAGAMPRACILTTCGTFSSKYCQHIHELLKTFHDEVTCCDDTNNTPLVFHLIPEKEGCVCSFSSLSSFGKIIVVNDKRNPDMESILTLSSDYILYTQSDSSKNDVLGKAIQAKKIIIPIRDETSSKMADALSIITTIQSAHKKRKLQDKQRRIISKLATHLFGKHRPELPEDIHDYVPPVLADCAHIVFGGDDDIEKIHSNKMLGNIFLGPRQCVEPHVYPTLQEFNVAGIVNCTPNIQCHLKKHGIRYCQVPLYDEPSSDILPYLDGVALFIHCLISKGKSVLVHCEAGISRSSTVVIAYWMRYHGMRRDEAYLEVKKRRPCICPNHGFWKQLQVYETRCSASQSKDYAMTKLLHKLKSPDASAAGWDMNIANASLCMYRVLHDCLDLMDSSSSIFQNHTFVNDNPKHVLCIALDLIWGHGLLLIDLQWLQCLCMTLEAEVDSLETGATLNIVRDLLCNESSEFTQLWSGEIYEHQINKVMKALQG